MTQPPVARETSNGNILVADDDHITRLFIQKMLQKAGFETHLVANGKEAINALESEQFDLVVMDCNMPLMDGFATTRYIRNAISSKIKPDIPVIAMTAFTSKTDLHQCIDAGMHTYVNKPVDAQTLIAAIEHCLGSRVIENQVSQQNEGREEQIWEDGFLDTLLSNFIAETPQVIAGLRQAINRRDLVELQNLGHRLRGATGVLKVSTLSERSIALERAGKAGDLTLASRLALELIGELHKLTTALNN